MQTLPSSFRSNLSLALNELLNDVEQIKHLVAGPKWKRMLSESGEKNEVLLSRIVFDLIQAKDHVMKTKDQLSEIISSEKK